MLVIGRKKNEALIIDDHIEIIVAEISGDKVRLVIDAPRDVVILRKELYEAGKMNVEANQDTPKSALKDLAAALQKKQYSDK